jgi:hypothetical protein
VSFFLGYRFLNSQGLVNGFLFFGKGGTPSYDTKMFLKVVFDKTAILNLRLVITLYKTLMKLIQNNQKSIQKSTPAYGFKKCQEKNP